eukprot:CAMPEP_0181023392 /NCGR_PEP_ID=MMETSP1070-20121207/2024_1 /TAXON_ID=265543 /ORGANISM="Minutocellus polymorphus, Strain NH13" /LENGTH=403 /DNA_ID=CAMNT_0023100399 /DNA_START=81 /DNA_END=1292 /DNA_ORIENTATION=-
MAEPEHPEDKIPILQPDRVHKSPTCVIVVGMAGSGKTTLMAQLQRSLADGSEDALSSEGAGGDGGESEAAAGDDTNATPRSKPPTGYLLNLDPATKVIPYGASIDIRDTVDYHQVMAQHKLGPNGAILTCLNLFATKFDQVMSILERRSFGDAPTAPTTTSSSDDGEEDSKPAAEAASSPPTADVENDKEAKTAEMKKLLDYILVDTPGQIESFSWSASGQIFAESLASAFPTILAYVVDTPRCASSPNTFMSNMLYACSMMYRTRLPLVVVFNKTDVVGSEFAEEWMTDYEAFQTALDDFTTENSGDAATSGYYASLTRSLSLVLDEFYSVLHHCGVSAATGDGVPGFWDTVDRAAQDFEADYVADLRDRVEERKARRRAKTRHDMKRLERDMKAASVKDEE